MKIIVEAFLVTLIVFIVNSQSCGKIYLPNSENQKKSWVKILDSKNTDSLNLGPVYFFGENNAISYVGENLIQTYDGGKSWQKVGNFENTLIQSFYFIDSQNGYATGGKISNTPVLFETEDSGKTWTELRYKRQNRKYKEITDTFQDVCFLDEAGIGWAVGVNGIYKIRHQELEWEILKIVKTPYPLDTVTCSSIDEVFAIGQKNKLYHYLSELNVIDFHESHTLSNIKQIQNELWLTGAKIINGKSHAWLKSSQNNGETWNEKSPKEHTAAYFGDVVFLNNEGYLVGTNGSIYYSNDTGESWDLEAVTDASLRQIFFLNKSSVLILGTQGTLLKRQ